MACACSKHFNTSNRVENIQNIKVDVLVIGLVSCVICQKVLDKVTGEHVRCCFLIGCQGLDAIEV
eukprot:4999094-Ditylum_brightwellii.AAC.1